MTTPRGAAIAIAPDDAAVGFRAYGGGLALWRCRDHEVILSGPFETGKTTAGLHKLNALLCKYPGSRALLVRKSYKSLKQSAVVTFEKNVLAYPPRHPKCVVQKTGGDQQTLYTYPNGSMLVLGGLDNPDKFLSSEWDFIYVNQAEELTEQDWQALTGRATGRAANAPYPQVMGDCNPSHSNHWILKRPSLTLLTSRHEDNPTLFDPVTGLITERGKLTMAILDALTGVYYLRGRLGKWVSAEGQVYEEFNRDTHWVKPFEPEPSMRRVWVVDFGFTNPFVWHDVVIDHDGRATVLHEIYMTGRLVEDHARKIKEVVGDLKPEILICDHDAEDRATLERYLGIGTTAAYKAIAPGIQAVQARLRKAGDGRPRLAIMQGCLVEQDPALAAARKPTSTLDEFEVYQWPKGQDGVTLKEAPIKANDHGMDALRYLCAHLDDIQNAAPDSSHLTLDPILERDNRPGLTLAEMEW